MNSIKLVLLNRKVKTWYNRWVGCGFLKRNSSLECIIQMSLSKNRFVRRVVSIGRASSGQFWHSIIDVQTIETNSAVRENHRRLQRFLHYSRLCCDVGQTRSGARTGGMRSALWVCGHCRRNVFGAIMSTRGQTCVLARKGTHFGLNRLPVCIDQIARLS